MDLVALKALGRLDTVKDRLVDPKIEVSEEDASDSEAEIEPVKYLDTPQSGSESEDDSE
jgi:hypothetical protein